MPRKYVPPPLELVKSRIEELLPPAAKEDIDGGAVVIDVRDPERFEAGHVQGAVNVPSGESARDAHEAAYAEAIEQAGARSRRPRHPGLRRGQPLGAHRGRAAERARLRERGLGDRRIEALERSWVSDRGRDHDRR